MLFILVFLRILIKKIFRKPLVLNQKYGLGMEYYDLTDNISYPSLSSVVVKSLTEKN